MLHDREKTKVAQTAPSQLLEATVDDPVTDDDGFLRVEIDTRKGAVEACPWEAPPIDQPQPVPGDAAWVMESDAGNFVCLRWWPNG